MNKNKELNFSLVYFFRQASKMLSLIFTNIKGATFGGNLDPFYFLGIKYFFVKLRNKQLFLEFLIFVIPVCMIALLQIVGLTHLNILKFFVMILKIFVCVAIMLYVKNCKVTIDLKKICKYLSLIYFFSAILSLFSVYDPIIWRNADYTNIFDLRRLQLFYLEPSELGFHVSLVIIVLFSFWMKTCEKKEKKNLLLFLLMNIFPLYLSKSLGAIAVVILTISLMVVYDIIINFNRKKTLIIALCMIAPIIFLVFIINSNNSLVNRFMRVLQGNDGSVNYRITVSMKVLNNSLSDYYYIGSGLGNVNTPQFIQRYSYLRLDQMIVNSFLYFWTESGIFGIIYWFFLMIYILSVCFKSKNLTKMGLLTYVFIFQFMGSHFTNGLIWLIYGYSVSKENN